VLQKLLGVAEAADQRAQLVSAGLAWLPAREDHPAWTFVLQNLLDVAEAADQRAQLVSAGLAWLPAREDHPEWTFVLQKLLDVAEAADQRAQLVSAGLAWLPAREDRPEWTFVLQKLLDVAEAADQRAQLVSAGLEFILERKGHVEWKFVFGNLLEVVKDDHPLRWRLLCALEEHEARRHARRFLKEPQFSQLTVSTILTELLDVWDPRMRGWPAIVDLLTDRVIDPSARTVLTRLVTQRLSKTHNEELRIRLDVVLSRLRRQVEQPYISGELVSGLVTAAHIYGVFINTTAGEVLLPISHVPVRLLPEFMESIQVGQIQQVCIDGWDATRNSWRVSHPEFARPSGAGPDQPATEVVEARVIWATKNYALLDINGLSGVLHKSKTPDPEALKTWRANETRCVRVLSWDAATTRWVLADPNYEPSCRANAFNKLSR
jgi:Pumilio-family RNA binding repeat